MNIMDHRDTKTLRGLSLWEPWASAMANGFKSVETRGWKTDYRGDILICAALTKPARCHFETESEYNFSKTFPFGMALCIVELYDCTPTEEIGPWLSAEEQSWGNYTSGRWAWMTRERRRLVKPIKFRGKQGLFKIPAGNANGFYGLLETS